jgi:hypothetical protein
MRIVNGYFCRNCADVVLAKKGLDPADPQDSAGEVYVPPPPHKQFGINRPEPGGVLGTRLNLHG